MIEYTISSNQTLGVALITASTNISTETWAHVSVCCQGGTDTLYLNGLSVGSASLTANFSDGNIFIGRNATAASGYWVGQISAMQLTLASRMTANFTPPNSPFLTIGG